MHSADNHISSAKRLLRTDLLTLSLSLSLSLCVCSIFCVAFQTLLFSFLPSFFPFSLGIEDLREKREEINRQLGSDEQEKAKIQNDLAILTRRLAHLNEKLSRQVRLRLTAGKHTCTHVYTPRCYFSQQVEKKLLFPSVSP